MDTIARFRRQVHYHVWANRQIGDALVAALDDALDADVLGPSIRWFAHLVACDDLWLSRIAQISFDWKVWPEDPLPIVIERLYPIVERWDRLLTDLDDPMLDTPIAYVNSQGQSFENRVADILEHVVIHGGYHRGQIAADLRARGHVPPLTDFIHAVRQGLVE